MPISVSACIICLNEAHRIAAALDSLLWCNDIVVVDSGSTDDTRRIVENHRARPRFVHHPWAGYSAQRKFAVEQCRHDWVLALDADEECSPELAAEIARLTADGTGPIAQFRMPRKNYIGGRYVRCWSPDDQFRLLHKSRVRWEPQSAPEVRHPLAGYRTAHLKGPLLHNRLTPFDLRDFNDGPRMAEHAYILAQAMAASGRRATFMQLLLRPLITFLKYYIFRGGILQGRFGLAICYKTTIGVMLKYSVLYAREQWNLQADDTPNRQQFSPATAEPIRGVHTDKALAAPPGTSVSPAGESQPQASGRLESDSNAGANAG